MDEVQTRERLSLEELANCVTHGIGMVLSLVGFAALLVMSSLYGNTWHIVSTGIYGLSLVLLYMASTLYHGSRSPRTKRLLQHADHCGIYLLIAGTYTPFTLVVLRGAWGWTLFGLVWGLSVFGILFRVLGGERWPFVALASYLLMGWLAVIAIKPITTLLPLGALLLIAAGGIAYSGGIVFYSSKKMRYGHAIWHVFVLAGSICHYLAVMLYVIPART